MILKVGTFEFKRSEDEWIFKARDPKKLSKKYHDLPRFNSQLDIEEKFKENLSQKVDLSAKIIAKLLT